ncbi:MAG: hypothetical protein IPP59_12375 [Betaproteobacteria bacterium]|nr:hypothetical protein [Candidatus Dechloromonas phosphorivorans]
MYKSRLLPLLLVSAALFTAGCQTSQSTPKSPEKEKLSSTEVLERRQQIMDMSKVALDKLYAENPGAKAEIESAPGFAVFNISTVNAVVLVEAHGKGVLFDKKAAKHTFMLTARAGVGPGIGYQNLYQIFIFKSEAALAQFKVGDTAGGDVAASATMGTANKQYSFNPYITVYQVSEKGYAIQANWGGVAYLVDPNLN